MQNTCPSCGAETFPGARFCRRCGAAVGGGVGETGDVSPNAATVPLAAEQVRTTDGLAPNDERVAPQTSRVSLAEMERLLRAQDEAHAAPTPPHGADPEATLAARNPAATRPDFDPADYDEELTITVPRTAEARETGDFETTADFEATLLSDLEATRPASSTSTASGRVMRGTTADELESAAPTPAGSWTHGEAAAADGNGEASDGSGVAHVGGPPINSAPVNSAPVKTAPGARPKRGWTAVVAVVAIVAVVAGGGAWLAFRLFYRPAVIDVPTQPAAPPPASDAARQQFDQKLAESESLLAAGDIQGAMARLREANEIDPANWRARRRLGDLLFESGARRAAIEEYRAATRNAPDDFEAWRRLAIMQQEEGLDRDAVESFRRFIALTGGEAAVDPNDLFAYAVVLRRSGLMDEARALFQRLASSSDARVAGSARTALDELARAQPTPVPTQVPGAQPSPTPGVEMVSVTQPAAPPAPAQPTPPPPTPTPAPPAPAAPAERYGRGVQLWSSNRGAALDEFRAAAAGGSLDAHYYLGLAYVEGRNAGSLKRAEVVAALQHFQLAQRGGQHASQARGYAQQLEKEFDRLRRQ
ncbi:MAG TPA: tetratricopeptide repeat protein [Pyrinomonadaceae bacterium]|jgi:tetratricopeptide (TPR) repeat protein